MSTNSRKGPVVDPGLCRCCGSTKKCRVLNVEYEWIGQKEVYSDMFVDTFGLLLSHLDGDLEQRLICATCVSRLRDATAFRRQVLTCEQQLLNTSIKVYGAEMDINTIVKREKELTVVLENLSHTTTNKDDFNKQQNEVAPRDDLAGTQDDLVRTQDDLDDIRDDLGTQGDCNQDGDSDDEVLAKKETKSKVKKIKKVKKAKSKRKKKISRADKELAKKETLAAMEIMERRLEEINYMDEPRRPKAKEGDDQNLQNTITIVENSYVCPFDTSFSDYFCIYCREVFTDPDKLRQHTATHDPMAYKEAIVNKRLLQIDITRLECRLCSEKPPDLNSLKEHLKLTHEKKLFNLKNEFLTFKLSKNLTCLECGVAFSFFHALKKHMAEHFGTCICDICGAHYFEERMLVLHQKTHQKVDENFPCETCGKVFKSKHSRYLHETKTHKKEPAYQCSRCDEVLFSYSLRYRHMIEVHGEQRMFQCSHCDRSYDSRKSLREHIRRCHMKILKHQCDLCDKRFYIPSRLKEHMATHTGERNFRCDCCGKTYPRLRGLKVHMQCHSGDKRHRCAACGAAFTQHANLKTHLKRHHSDVSELYNE